MSKKRLDASANADLASASALMFRAAPAPAQDDAGNQLLKLRADHAVMNGYFAGRSWIMGWRR
jgi:hypothetical protein